MLRDEMKREREEASEEKRKSESFRQYITSIEDSIRQDKIERAQAYFDLVGWLEGNIRESMANAEAFKEAEKQRVPEIHHNGNSDMEGCFSEQTYRNLFEQNSESGIFTSMRRLQPSTWPKRHVRGSE